MTTRAKPDPYVIVVLYLCGLSTRQIGKLLSHPHGMIAHIVKAEGISRTQSAAAMLRQPPKSKHWRSSRQAARKAYQRYHQIKLTSDQHVHHINHNHTDNRIENLTILNASEHTKHHHPKNPIPRWLRPDRREYMKAYLKEYGKTYKRKL